MVYVFGDLRQLRKFELARPAISKPLPVPVVTSLAGPMPRPPEPSKRPNVVMFKHYDKQYDPAHFSSMSLRSAPYPHSTQRHSLSSECSDTELSETSEDSELSEIEVSPAYFDDSPAPEGPATATGLYRSRYCSAQSSVAFPSPLHTQERTNPVASLAPIEHRICGENVRNNQEIKSHNDESGSFGPSAAFIRHEMDLNMEDQGLNGRPTFEKGQNEKEHFDFDLLPKSGKGNAIRADNVRLTSIITTPIVATSADHIPANTENPTPSNNPLTSAIARQQYKCKRTYLPPLSLISHASSVHLPDSNTSSPTSSSTRSPLQVVSFMIPSFTAGVPAFKAPMTRVHSPAVIRAQWEVVIRSAILALIGAITLVALFVGVVP
jgi:hypothetical protein